jgi:hypothetical protein
MGPFELVAKTAHFGFVGDGEVEANVGSGGGGCTGGVDAWKLRRVGHLWNKLTCAAVTLGGR